MLEGDKSMWSFSPEHSIIPKSYLIRILGAESKNYTDFHFGQCYGPYGPYDPFQRCTLY